MIYVFKHRATRDALQDCAENGGVVEIGKYPRQVEAELREYNESLVFFGKNPLTFVDKRKRKRKRK